uniref:Insulin-like domain-containing protein n=1 Tax=Poecilia latipinna TaxID=48699 RepID=A0A3B3TUK0_9TELE
MLWRVTVALAVMCVGGACNSMGADMMGRLLMPRDYRVKLCGREFIRAVIFTCGGSRWKRSTEGEEGFRFPAQSPGGAQPCCAAASSQPPPPRCCPAAGRTGTSPRCQSCPAAFRQNENTLKHC